MRGAALALAMIAILGVGAWLLRSRVGADAGRLRADMEAGVERGSFADLGRAQAIGRRLVLADSGDREAAAALAFACAALAVDYGADTAREAEMALGAPATAGGSGGAASGAVADAARALVLLHAGDREGAARLAAAAAAAAPGTAHPLYALGRARAAGGDLAGASRALQAAIVGAPAFVAARFGWAEVRLDAGDAKTARLAIEEALALAPKDPRGRLLLVEAEQALGGPAAGDLDAACPDGGRPPPAIAAGCALAFAERARRSGAREQARARLDAAAVATVPDEPRLLARAAQTLAELGAVDRAAALVDRAGRLASPEMPALAWATAALALGRGWVGVLPGGLRPAAPEERVIAARAALAAGGLGALGAALDGLGEAALAGDADLRTLARLRGGGEARAPSGPAGDPLAAYVDGLRAHLGGDLLGAAERFSHGLSGHGDACRAAGEYVATLRALKRHADPSAFVALRAENAGCVNLKKKR
jgi:tetratricopeptide (TPR) repeat protein